MATTEQDPTSPTILATERGPRHVVDLRDPVEGDIAFRVSLAWRELRRGASASAVRDYFFGHEPDAIEQGQMDALDVLVTRAAGWRMGDLAEALRVDPSTATRSVQRLVNDGLAVRRASEDDGRVVVVAISPEGKRRHAAVAKRRIVALTRLLGEFDTDERRTLADLLERFVGALDLFVAELNDAAEAADAATGDVRHGARADPPTTR
jgi:DNA-binding MarR family transcriptional regulator